MICGNNFSNYVYFIGMVVIDLEKYRKFIEFYFLGGVIVYFCRERVDF